MHEYTSWRLITNTAVKTFLTVIQPY